MQPNRGEMQAAITHPLIPNPNPNGDLFDDMFSVIPPWPYDDSSSLLAVRLRHQQIDSPLLPPLPLSLSANSDSDGVGFGMGQLQHLHQPQSFGGWPPAAAAGSPAIVGRAGGGVKPPRQRVRARRGQATDPHSIAERLRRERIAERMKALQELVPNANKTDKSSTLDVAIDYVRFLQLQVKVLSMSRLGGSAAVSSFIADIPSEWRESAAAANEAISAAEESVTKLLIEEDIGSVMQHLQESGLCLMPISLASAIATATSPASASATLVSGIPAGGDAPPSSPSIMSVLTVQSVVAGSGGDNGVCRPSVKDAA